MKCNTLVLPLTLSVACKSEIVTMDATLAPTASAALPRATTQTSLPDIGESTIRILLVDNDLSASGRLQQPLLAPRGKQQESEVKCVLHGLDAMVVAESFQPHLVVIEVGWPRQSGDCTAKLLRSRPWANNLVIVSHTRERQGSVEPGEHFDFHFFDEIDIELLMQIFDNLALRRRSLERSPSSGTSSKFRLRTKTH